MKNDEEEDVEVDLASYAYQIWKNATDSDPSLKKTIPDLPNVIYATKSLKQEGNTKEEEKTYKEPQIICSLGLIRESGSGNP